MYIQNIGIYLFFPNWADNFNDNLQQLRRLLTFEYMKDKPISCNLLLYQFL